MIKNVETAFEGNTSSEARTIQTFVNKLDPNDTVTIR